MKRRGKNDTDLQMEILNILVTNVVVRCIDIFVILYSISNRIVDFGVKKSKLYDFSYRFVLLGSIW